MSDIGIYIIAVHYLGSFGGPSAQYTKNNIYTLDRTKKHSAFALNYLEGSTTFIERVKNNYESKCL